MSASGLICRLCGDVIGAYEPIIAVGVSGLRNPSVAAEPWLEPGDADLYHRDCFTSADPESAVRNPASSAVNPHESGDI